jgi:dTDP-4-amino-4,6-dideoxygalactose transaminase
VLHELRRQGIGAGVHYPKPVHLLPCFEELGYARGDFLIAERLSDEELSLPVFPGLTDEQIARVARALVAATAG